MYSTFGGWGVLILLVYLVLAAIGFGLLYLCIRLAVLSALKAHTQWMQSGAPGSRGPGPYGQGPAGPRPGQAPPSPPAPGQTPPAGHVPPAPPGPPAT